MHNDDKAAPQDGCPCNVCHWARTGERSRTEFDSADLVSNYRAYEAGMLGEFDTDGYLAVPGGRA
jgi:hypothetical protein